MENLHLDALFSTYAVLKNPSSAWVKTMRQRRQVMEISGLCFHEKRRAHFEGCIKKMGADFGVFCFSL